MEFDKRLYVGESIRNKRRVKWKLRHNAGQVRVFVIALAKGEDQLEIYHCAFLQQKYYKDHPPYIVGIAGGYPEAVALVERMVMDIFEKTGNYNMKEYFLKRR